VFTKVLLSAAIVLGAALGMATPAVADPSVFGTLSCSCEDQVTGAEGGPTLADQVNAGIASALVDLQGISG
jgi:hypothetical protein